MRAMLLSQAYTCLQFKHLSETRPCKPVRALPSSDGATVLARPEGLEPPFFGFVDRRLILLDHERIEGSRLTSGRKAHSPCPG